jgi:hypothetical protein
MIHTVSLEHVARYGYTGVCDQCLQPRNRHANGCPNGDDLTPTDEPDPIEPMTPSLPDTGARTAFATGAVRDAMTGKGLPSMIPPEAIRRIALRFELGAEKYGKDNWLKGIPLSRYQDAIIRHLLAWAEGKTDEDHLGAVGWNMAAAVWTEDAIKAGTLPAELDDLPFRNRKPV